MSCMLRSVWNAPIFGLVYDCEVRVDSSVVIVTQRCGVRFRTPSSRVPVDGDVSLAEIIEGACRRAVVEPGNDCRR